MSEPKTFWDSKTVRVNLLIGLIWIVGLVIDSASSGTLPPDWMAYAGIVQTVGNLILRLLTSTPVAWTNPFGKLPLILLALVSLSTISNADQPRAVLVGPSGGVPGDELILDASGSIGSVFEWEVTRRGYTERETYFDVADDGQSLKIFSYPGRYDVLLIVANDDGIDYKRKTVVVWSTSPPEPAPDPLPTPTPPPGPTPGPDPGPIPPGPEPTPPGPDPTPPPTPPTPPPAPDLTGLARDAFNWSKLVENSASDAAAVANVFETISAQIAAGSLGGFTSIRDALKSQMETALTADARTRWVPFGEQLSKRVAADIDSLNTPTDWSTFFQSIARGLRAVH